METVTNISITTTLRLNRLEEFQAETMDNNRFGFFVNQITWTGDNWVSYHGPGRSRDGQRLATHRSDTWRSFSKLDEKLQLALIASRNEAISNMLLDERKAGRRS